MNKEKLKKLLDFGFITEDEQTRILQDFEKSGLTIKVKQDILNAIENVEKKLEKEEKDLEREGKEILAEISKVDVEIEKLQKKSAKEAAKVEYSKYLEYKNAQERAMHQIANEIKRAERKVEERLQNLRGKLEHLAIQKIKTKIN